MENSVKFMGCDKTFINKIHYNDFKTVIKFRYSDGAKTNWISWTPDFPKAILGSIQGHNERGIEFSSITITLRKDGKQHDTNKG